MSVNHTQIVETPAITAQKSRMGYDLLVHLNQNPELREISRAFWKIKVEQCYEFYIMQLQELFVN